MDATERCPACGAQLAPDVDWCGQCYARISRSGGEVRVSNVRPESGEESGAVARPAPPAASEPHDLSAEAPGSPALASPAQGSVPASPATAYEFLEQLA